MQVFQSSPSDIKMDSFVQLCNLTDSTSKQLCPQINTYLAPLKNDTLLPLLTCKEPCDCTLMELFAKAEGNNDSEATARLLNAVLMAEVVPMFHKINVHAALTPQEIKSLFDPVFSQAKLLHDIYYQKEDKMFTVSKSDNVSGPSFTDASACHVPWFVTVRIESNCSSKLISSHNCTCKTLFSLYWAQF